MPQSCRAARSYRQPSLYRLHHQRAVRGVDLLRAGSRAIATERGAARESDRIGDQLRALVTACRATAGIRDRVVREVDRAVDVLVAAALQRGVARVVTVPAAIAGRALLEDRDAVCRHTRT